MTVLPSLTVRSSVTSQSSEKECHDDVLPNVSAWAGKATETMENDNDNKAAIVFEIFIRTPILSNY
jgi:hypothetical protein